MTKTVKYILLTLALLLIILFCFRQTANRTQNTHIKCDSLSLTIDIPVEISDKYLILDNGQIVFSVNDSNGFFLKTYFNGNIEELMPHEKNLFNPTLIAGEISAIQDLDGNEDFKLTNNRLHEYIGTSSIQSIYTFQQGYLILIQLTNDQNLYLIDLKNNTRSSVVRITQKLNGVSFYEGKNSLVISYDNKFMLFDISTGSIINLADNLEGEKLNPYIYNDYAYFANNNLSEFYQIFRIDLNNPREFDAKPFFKQEHDLRIPKAIDNFLYFIEIINSEYILKRLNLQTLEIENITHTGVVYNYDFLKYGQIVMVYSDLTTPKNLMLFNENDSSFVNITGSKVNQDITSLFVESQHNTSSAYILQRVNTEIKGVILFIRPGMHSDFSPRWDDILMNLCNNGYVILAPNYPMSTGYGKSFYNASFEDAMKDIKEWKKYLQKQYKGIPLFCLSMSSGNIFMEELLSQHGRGIKAAVSLFGVPVAPNKKSFSVPTLYILGENDPRVNFHSRYSTLRENQQKHPSISIISYPNEGHWFREKKNKQNAICGIVKHLCLYSPN